MTHLQQVTLPEAAGYAHPAYARTLRDSGPPVALAASGGWLIARPIPGTPCTDAAAPYPLLCCRDWPALADDLGDLEASRRLVSVVAVIDPFAPVAAPLLARAFPDLVRPYKEHQVVRLDRPPDAFVSRHHRYYARRALRTLAAEPVSDLAAFAPEWAALYANLIARHGLRGLHAFSEPALRAQLAVPGAVAFRARLGAETVAGHVWYRQGDVAYSHLAAANEAGYRHSASYALHWEALGHFARQGVTWLDLGSVADRGGADGGRDGLLAFKAGWANEKRMAYLCGRILDRQAYRALIVGEECEYFPAYRRASR